MKVTEHIKKAKAIFGLFPANSVGDDIEVYEQKKLKL